MPTTAPPTVTVLITLYNKGPFVEEALASVIASDFGDIEILVVDDASTDDGPDRVIAMQDARIRLIRHHENTGRAAAANRGFDAARGEFIAILDADDRMMPDRIGMQLRFMRAHPEVIACGSAARIIGRGDHVASWPADDRECRARLIFEDALLDGSCMLRRAALEQHGIRCDSRWRTPGMDYLFQIALAPHGRFANLPQALTEYRIHDGNMRAGRDHAQDKLMIQRRVFEMIGLSHNEQQLKDHVLFHRMLIASADPTAIRRLRDWSRHLITWNREHRFAYERVFDATVRTYWDRIFYVLPDLGLRTALAHLLGWWPWRAGHAVYLAKYGIKAMLSRR